MSSPSRSRVVLACLLLVTSGPVLLAQFESATVLGTVHDPSGSAVPGARVTLENTRTGVRLQAVSDAAGNYEFVNQKIGTYLVRVEAPGFQTAATDRFWLVVYARHRAEIWLKIG